ncbi:hypothetical protein JJB07_18310 [Tumebacillus sp. ITR2]|uniref:Uncharacterized protein n=1 Tax=Tumebacillus amylolyticus TaxID=2801339 RepID=A0ABS1JE55_9BACL|nr:hypothetical protein [Tumebacillus amylolyticus]MBL0388561.1 hypothetical protein [Tumebacillus amylolyticus]
MKRMIAFAGFTVGLSIILTSPAHATITQKYNTVAINNPGHYDGVYCSLLIPNMTPFWSTGSGNKINTELWLNTNSTDSWVEVGYHDGYNWKSDGSIASTSYKGLFTAYANGSVWSVQSFPSKNWASGQSHTIGALLGYSSGSYYADMRVDGSVLLSYTNAAIGSVGETDVGVEWNTTNGLSPSASVTSSTFTDLNLHNSLGWSKWSSHSADFLYPNNTYPGYTANFDQTNNRIIWN